MESPLARRVERDRVAAAKFAHLDAHRIAQIVRQRVLAAADSARSISSAQRGISSGSIPRYASMLVPSRIPLGDGDERASPGRSSVVITI